ncbi:MAG: transglycosylase SLT domain-containing protein [Candidatus Competibacteraceae bacterium]|nr:transglycosylase SLT domain-containing protein [Candidatus Competibacteraceae bacterium]MCP5127845.1 transglycosylase SLT domain-containing protein [Gammaproteobacteria bacterium]HRX69707.1 transglycosylase SLT domain-containing protein [Candidatus Competibacteraceae bacterium]
MIERYPLFLSRSSFYSPRLLASRGVSFVGWQSWCWIWSGSSSLLTILLLLGACTTVPQPRNVSNACAIFTEYGDWYPDAKAASRRWGAPLPVLLAIIHQESTFRSDARPPPRTWYFGFIPGPRPTTAYGYSQALDSTWGDYIAATGNHNADRDKFDDAVDFVGWYIHQTFKRNHVAKHDAYHQYLAYHEGHGGFARGSYRKKPWLIKRAHEARQLADRYRAQLARCEPQLAGQQSSRWLF